MTLNKLIIDTLSPLNIPIHYITASDTVGDYIIFNDYNQGSALTADDEELTTNYYVQIDIFLEENFLEVFNQTKNLLKQAGLRRIYEAPGEYEENVGKFRKTVRFIYATEIKQGE
ncbi:hypothetical protein RVS70_07435 [Virgibacillus sp. M23]|uniref:hypothetical protein n=1 Tax=Virgibacillus sp. M23 TaxID=3079030 RepID=UPI002A9142B7|nr:hypothetical protein [Virgibacillus sp. M23]MDY7044037.1 hypothetical protein [Virgibacillus sp. M23]